MAEKVTFDYTQMSAVENSIRNTHAQAYTAAAQSFKSSMDAAIAGWKGESKDQFTALLVNTVYPHLEKSVPAMVTAMADVLKENIAAMSQVDASIAQQIAGAAQEG